MPLNSLCVLADPFDERPLEQRAEAQSTRSGTFDFGSFISRRFFGRFVEHRQMALS
jgi:hypothetical protein